MKSTDQDEVVARALVAHVYAATAGDEVALCGVEAPLSLVVTDEDAPPEANEVWSFECSTGSLQVKARAARELGLVPVVAFHGPRIVLSLRRA